MPAAARNMDTGVGACAKCGTPMSGVIAAANPAAPMIDGLRGASVGDIVTGACGHTGNIVAGSPTFKYGTAAAARVGDAFAGDFSGVIATGSPTYAHDGV